MTSPAAGSVERPGAGRGLAVLVGLATAAVFAPAIGHGFVDWDDRFNFLDNPYYRGLGPAQLAWMFTTPHAGPYVPLAWVSLGLDHVLWGMNPHGYHLTAVLLHAIDALLLYTVARALFDAAGARAHARAAALATALAWALHPLRVESVAWVTERRDVLAGLFVLLTVRAYLAAWRRGHDGRLAGGWLAGASACFALALLSKPTVLALPLVLLVLDVYPLGRAWGLAPGTAARRLLLEKGALFAVSAGAATLALVIGARRGMLTGLEALGGLERLAVSSYALAFYVVKTIVPAGLSPLYTLFLPVDPLGARYLAAAALVIAITAAALALGRRWPGGLVAWTASLLLIVPVLGPLHTGAQVAADRYTYVPAMAWSFLAGMAVVAVARLVAAGRAPRALGRLAAATGLAALVAWVALTEGQIAVWRDSVTLWRRAAAVEPQSDIPIFHLGWALSEAGRHAEARAHFERALARVPARLPALRAQLALHLGIVDEQGGDAGRAEARLREALALDPGHPVAAIRLAGLLLRQERAPEARALLARAAHEADRWSRYKVWELRQALATLPAGAAPAADVRGALVFAFALTLQRAGAFEDAELAYRDAVALRPGDAAAWNNLGVVQAQRGRATDALDAFARAVQARPGDPDACANARRVRPAAGAPRPPLDGCPATR